MTVKMMNESQEIIEKLKTIGKDTLKEINDGKSPSLNIIQRSLNNVYFDKETGLIMLGDKKQKRTYFNINQAKKFMQTLLVTKQIKWILEQNQPALSTRQLYYTLKHSIPGTKENTFDDQQTESDPIIEDVEVMVDALREQLKLIATPNGVIAGALTVKESTGETLDYSKMGSAGGAIPPIVEKDAFEFKSCTADFVLVVEKYAVWNLLNQQKYWKNANCILMTGKGQPARSERRLLHRLSHDLKLPVYIFTDLDPWGYYIYSVYKQGSINLAFFSEKAGCPNAKYIGFSTKDVTDYDIPKSAHIKLNDLDLKRIKEISAYDWFKKPEWQKELSNLKKLGVKVEQDALVAKSIEFTAKEYLPKKLEEKDFLH